jgi:RES domain-containing protein
MEVFRLSRRKFAEPLSGHGAALRGARWNSMGIEMIYTAENRSLAMAEVAVHLSLANLPEDFVMLTIEIPDDASIKEIMQQDLPLFWNSFPALESTKRIGDQFILENKFLALKIPSVVTKDDFNILINPRHEAFKKVQITQIEAFPFDQRLFK